MIDRFLYKKKDIENFHKWAFGVTKDCISSRLDAMNYWNSLHSDLMILKPHGTLNNDIPKMIELWRMHKKE